MNSKIELNYPLFFQNHNFNIACPNATKNPLNSFVHRVFYSYQELNLSRYSVKVKEFQSFDELNN